MSMKEFLISVGPVNMLPIPSHPDEQTIRQPVSQATIQEIQPWFFSHSALAFFDPSAHLTGSSSNMYPVSDHHLLLPP